MKTEREKKRQRSSELRKKEADRANLFTIVSKGDTACEAGFLAAGTAAAPKRGSIVIGRSYDGLPV